LHDECKQRAAQTLNHIEQRREPAPANAAATTNVTGGNKARVAAARAKSERKSAAANT